MNVVVSPFRSISVSAISSYFLSSSLMLWIRGASSDIFVLLALSSSSLHWSSIVMLLMACKHSLYSSCTFVRCWCKDFLAKISSTDSSFIMRGEATWKDLTVLPNVRVTGWLMKSFGFWQYQIHSLPFDRSLKNLLGTISFTNEPERRQTWPCFRRPSLQKKNFHLS